jgi:hypothetical protein
MRLRRQLVNRRATPEHNLKFCDTSTASGFGFKSGIRLTKIH